MESMVRIEKVGDKTFVSFNRYPVSETEAFVEAIECEPDGEGQVKFKNPANVIMLHVKTGGTKEVKEETLSKEVKEEVSKPEIKEPK